MLGVRYLDKLKRDPLMYNVYKVFEGRSDVYSLMDRVGFFEESFETSPEWYLENLITPINRVRDNLLEYSGGGSVVVLLTTGGFSPLHLGHVEMMERAREVLESNGHNVVGGYFSPSHDEYVGTKRGGEAACEASVRVEMVRRSLVGYDWLDVDPWESMYCEGSVNYTEVLARLEKYLNVYLGDLVGDSKIRVCYVFGTDNIGFVDVFRSNEGSMCVYVGDRDSEYDWLVGGNVGMTYFTSSNKLDYSSTDFRRGRSEVLSKEMRDIWDEINDSRSLCDGVYEIRDDFELSINEKIKDRLYMKEGLIQLIYVYVDCDVELLSVSDQVSRFSDWRGDMPNVVSLDVYVSTGNDLGMSRVFEISSGQYVARGLSDRIGSDNGNVCRHFEDGYWVVDDDTASGYTLDRVNELIEGEFLGFVGLNDLVRDHGRDCVDVVDLRDFIFGASHGGLAVRLGEQDVRVMYALPYVNVASRATVRYGDVMEFSKRLVEWNIELYKNSGVCVRDLDSGTVRFVEYMGLGRDELVEDVLVKLYRGVLYSGSKCEGVGRGSAYLSR